MLDDFRSFVEGAEKNKIVIFGGSDRTGSHFNDLHVLEFRHSAVSYQQCVFIFGGQCVHALDENEQTGEFYADLWKYDLAANTWTQIQPAIGSAAPVARNAHTASVVGCKMYIIGGSNHDGPIADVSIVDLDTHVWENVPPRSWDDVQAEMAKLAANLQSTRIDDDEKLAESASAASPSSSSASAASASAASSSSAISSSSSSSSKSKSKSKSSKKKSLAEDEDDSPATPEAREMHSAVVSGSSLLVFGGRTSETVCDHYYEFLKESRSWRLHDRCLPLCGHASALFGQRVIHFGGTNCLELFDSVQVFNTEMLVWTEPELSGPTPRPRMAHTLTQISPSQAVLFGGAGMDGEFNDLLLLTDGDALSHGKQS